MPGFNRQGPMGQGPMTGGARGYCRPGASSDSGAPVDPAMGYDQEIYMGRGYGYGARSGMGRCRGGRGVGGRGRGMMWTAPVPGASFTEAAPVDNMANLRRQAASLQNSLSAIEKQIADLENATSSDQDDK